MHVIREIPDDLLELQQRLARFAGLLYLILALLGMFAPTVLQTLVVPGDAATTTENLSSSRWLFASSLVAWLAIVVMDITIAVTLYLLLAPANRAVSLFTAALRLVYSAMLGAALLNLFLAYRLLTGASTGAGLDGQQRQAMALSAVDAFNAGFLVALVLFGVHLLALGSLLYRSHYVPRALGIAVVAAGAGYMVDSLAQFLAADYGGLVRVAFLAPALAGELGLTAWLLIKGVAVRRDQATDSVADARRMATT